MEVAIFLFVLLGVPTAIGIYSEWHERCQKETAGYWEKKLVAARVLLKEAEENLERLNKLP